MMVIVAGWCVPEDPAKLHVYKGGGFLCLYLDGDVFTVFFKVFL